jgi:2-dehydropantoate 2-reductase
VITILGAGSVGLSVGARLARAGERVLFVTRRPEAAAALDEQGVRLEDPASGEAWSARDGVEAVAGVAAAGPRMGDGPVLLCVRATDTTRVAMELAAAAPHATVASLQNDVDNCAALSKHFSRVVGGVYRQTCTRVSDSAAVALGWGRVVLGAWPQGRSTPSERLAGALRAAGYDVGVSERIGADQWLKLCVNLMSAPNALIRRDDHETQAFVDVKVQLLEEAHSVLEAAGIEARSCDGRDRSIAQEIAFQRESLARGASARRLPVYNQVWSALRHGGPLEADRYHQRILALAAAHGLAAPRNARVLEAVTAVWRSKRGPECLSAAELLTP